MTSAERPRGQHPQNDRQTLWVVYLADPTGADGYAARRVRASAEGLVPMDDVRRAPTLPGLRRLLPKNMRNVGQITGDPAIIEVWT